MPIRIMEDPVVAPMGAAVATRGEDTIIVLDPALPDAEKYQLVKELLG